MQKSLKFKVRNLRLHLLDLRRLLKGGVGVQCFKEEAGLLEGGLFADGLVQVGPGDPHRLGPLVRVPQCPKVGQAAADEQARGAGVAELQGLLGARDAVLEDPDRRQNVSKLHGELPGGQGLP